ncbi:MAG TPA: hypothetical protein VHN14_14035 [Kofleriaceae bacterium]|nr:hypothetical protein [Kofleriaceae bacterium]
MVGSGDQNARALKHRWFVVALALVAASAFALSVQAGRWWSIGDVEIGPFGSHSPFGGPGSLSWVGGSARWERFGVATWAGSLLAMFVLVVMAGAVAANRVPRLAARTALVAIATAGLAAIAFVAARPDHGMPFVIGRGMVLFAAGVTAGVIGAVGVLRARSKG